MRTKFQIRIESWICRRYGISKITMISGIGLGSRLPGRQVYQQICRRFPPRAGAKLLIACTSKRLQMRQSLQQQGIATWTGTYHWLGSSGVHLCHAFWGEGHGFEPHKTDTLTSWEAVKWLVFFENL